MTALILVPGARLIAGVDEVGRGPLAGPVVAAAVILLRPLDGLANSKLLDAATRERLAHSLREVAPDRRRRRLGQARSIASTSCTPACWRCAVPCCASAACPTLP